jgi:hypothetical protein
MSQLPKWFDRKFEFTFPVELHPNLCVRLRGTPARLEELIRDRSPGVLVRRLEEKWSAQEHAGHLLDIEGLWWARAHDFIEGRAELTVADLSNRKTHEANHNARSIGEIVAGFRTARLKLLDYVQGQGSAVFGRSLLHPRLKTPMRLVDHLYFAAEHDDHHLAWMWELVDVGTCGGTLGLGPRAEHASYFESVPTYTPNGCIETCEIVISAGFESSVVSSVVALLPRPWEAKSKLTFCSDPDMFNTINTVSSL